MAERGEQEGVKCHLLVPCFDERSGQSAADLRRRAATRLGTDTSRVRLFRFQPVSDEEEEEVADEEVAVRIDGSTLTLSELERIVEEAEAPSTGKGQRGPASKPLSRMERLR